MELNDREKILITYGLFVLENQCFNDGEDLHHEIKDELIEKGGVPDADETRELMGKIEEESVIKYTPEEISKFFQRVSTDLGNGNYTNINDYASAVFIGKQLQAEVKKLKRIGKLKGKE